MKSKAEQKNICKLHSQIADRYELLCAGMNITPDDRMSTMMDLEAVSQAYPNFRWKELLEADDFNFSHDIGGIKRHIDRSKAFTGGNDDLKNLLRDCFVPRFCGSATKKKRESMDDEYLKCRHAGEPA